MQVAIALCYRVGMSGTCTVPLPLADLDSMGVTRYSAYRGLKVLELAGLVSVERGEGKKQRVTLLNFNPI
jgi:hypothetical protein